MARSFDVSEATRKTEVLSTPKTCTKEKSMKVSLSAVKLSQKEVQKLFKEHKDPAKKYKKVGTVVARAASEGEKIDTVIDGVKETTNTAHKGDWVVTGPKGEEYIISGEKFDSRYKATDKPNVFKATGVCYAIEYRGLAFQFDASWGERMIMKSGDYLASLSPTGSEPYRIEREVFHKTYKEA